MSTIDFVRDYTFPKEKHLDTLKNYQSNENNTPTSMVSLIIPPSYSLDKLRQKMIQEQSTASNIKNRLNRQSVQSALTKINVYLKEIKDIPNTGIALFAEQYI